MINYITNGICQCFHNFSSVLRPTSDTNMEAINKDSSLQGSLGENLQLSKKIQFLSALLKMPQELMLGTGKRLPWKALFQSPALVQISEIFKRNNFFLMAQSLPIPSQNLPIPFQDLPIPSQDLPIPCSVESQQALEPQDKQLVMLRDCINNTFDDDKILLQFTLREYIVDLIDQALCSHPPENVSINKVSPRLYAMMDEFDRKKFKNNFDILYDGIDLKKPILLPLMVELGRKWFNEPLFKILDLEMPSTWDSSAKGCLEAIRRNNKVDFPRLIHMLTRCAHSQKEICNKLWGIYLNEYSKLRFVSIHNQLTQILRDVDLVKDELIGFPEFKFCNQGQADILNDYTFAKLKHCNEMLNKYSIRIIDVLRQKMLVFKSTIGNKLNETKEENEIFASLNMALNDINTSAQQYYERYRFFRGDKTDLEIHQSLSWLMFGDEISEKNKISKKVNFSQKAETLDSNKIEKVKSKQANLIGKGETKVSQNLSIKNVSGKKNEQKIFRNTSSPYEDILKKNALFIHDLSKEIKNSLRLQQTESQLNATHFERAKLHSKELRDHLLFATLNFDLFCRALMDKDLYAIGAVIPFLCLDLHLAMEQLIKHHIAVKGIEPSPLHNLSDLCTYASITISPELKSFIADFRDAMLIVRYPIAWKHKKQMTGPFKAMECCQKLCQDIEGTGPLPAVFEPESLKTICTSMIESYQKTLKFMIQEVPLDADYRNSAILKCDELIGLKTCFNPIFTNAKKLISEAKSKKASLGSKSDRSILELRQKLSDLGTPILKWDGIDQMAAKQALDETLNHLSRIDAISYVQQKFLGLKYLSLHHRHLLSFQWAFEQLYIFIGFATKVGDLRWLGHDLVVFHALIDKDFSRSPLVDAFNFRRNLCYNYERGKSRELPMMQDLLEIKKALKQCDPVDPSWTLVTQKNPKGSVKINERFEEMQGRRFKILNDGKNLLEILFKILPLKPEYTSL